MPCSVSDPRNYLSETEREILSAYPQAERVEMLSQIGEGKSGAKVLLVSFSFRDSVYHRYDGYNYLKFADSATIQAEINAHNTARTGIEAYVPEVIGSFLPVRNGISGLVMKPAGDSVLSARSLNKILERGEANSDQQAEILRQVCEQILETWSPRQLLTHTTRAAYQWLLDALDCGTTRGGARLTEAIAVSEALVPKTVQRIWNAQADRNLPNPIYYLNTPEAWQNREIAAPLGKQHADLHGGNLICLENALDKSPALIDFARMTLDAPRFFDLVYLELDVLISKLRVSNADWPEWKALLDKLMADVPDNSLQPRSAPAPNDAYCAYNVVQPIRKYAESIVQSVPLNLQETFRAAYWITYMAVALLYMRRDSYAERPERQISYLCAAYALEKALVALRLPLPTSAPHTVDFTPPTPQPASLPSHEAEIEYAQCLLTDEDLSLLREVFVPLTGEQAGQINAAVPISKPRPTLGKLIRPNVTNTKLPMDAIRHETHTTEREKRAALPNVREALRESDRVVLLGEPGSGKTTTLLRLHLDYLSALEKDSGAAIPIFVRLAQYRGVTPEDFIAFVQEQLAFAPDALIAAVPHLLQTERVILLCDALNEMPRQDPRTLASLNKALAPIKRVIVSCRVKDFDKSGDLKDAGRFSMVEIKDLTPPLIKEMIEQFRYLDAERGEWRTLSPDNIKHTWVDQLSGSDDLLAAWDAMSAAGYEDAFWRDQDPPKPLLRDETLKERSWNKFDRRDAARRAMLRSRKGLMLLCRSPYMLYVTLETYRSTDKIARNRGALFGEFVAVLLNREIKSANERGEPWAEGTREALIEGLSRLAEVMQIERNITDIRRDEAVRILNPNPPTPFPARGERGATDSPSTFTERGAGGEVALTPIPQPLSPHAEKGEQPDSPSMFTERGQGGEVIGQGGEVLFHLALACSILQETGDSVRFTHQLLQEYFASHKLREAMDRNLPASTYWRPDQWWKRTGREQTAHILVGVRGADNPDAFHETVAWLAQAQPELALEATFEINAAIRDLTPEVRQTLINAARAKSELPHPPPARAAAWRVISRLGADTRPGVGLIPNTNIPDVAWCDQIPVGEFIMGEDQFSDNPRRIERIEKPYRIAKYPVTYAQFKAFKEAEDGYWQDHWWREFDPHALEARVREDRQYFKTLNHPAERVNWWECMAFCKWLTAQYRALKLIGENEAIRLPTEQEWERAARGTQGLIYAYGNQYAADKQNGRDTGIGQTSAVGILPYPSPAGAYDMTGNVWEWCLNEYDNPQNTGAGRTAARVLRGGSWGYTGSGLLAAGRNWFTPGLEGNSLGFRCVLCSF